MLQQDAPDDYVVATGVEHSVRELVEVAFAHAGLDWQRFVTIDPAFIRPAEVERLIGDATKARRVLGWEPTVDFAGLVGMMVDADLERLRRSPAPQVSGSTLSRPGPSDVRTSRVRTIRCPLVSWPRSHALCAASSVATIRTPPACVPPRSSRACVTR